MADIMATIGPACADVNTLAEMIGSGMSGATQMFERMVHNQWPTRTDVSDVCNARLDGADAVQPSVGSGCASELRVVDVERFPVNGFLQADLADDERMRANSVHFFR